MLRVETIEELFHYATMFETQPLMKGRRIGIVTNAGGPGIMATDAAVRSEITIPRFPDYTLRSLKNQLPATASLKNPVDDIAAGGGRLSERRESGEVATPQRTLYTHTSSDQSCKSSDRLDVKQSPERWLHPLDNDLNRLLVKGSISNL